MEQLDGDLLVPIVYFADTRWHTNAEGRIPLEPFAVCALACVSKTLTSKLRQVRPVIRTGTFGRTRSGQIESVAEALDFERRSVWQIGQLSTLSYSQVDDVSGLTACRMLHTLQLTQCLQLRSLDGLGACPSLSCLHIVNARIRDVAGLRNAAKLAELKPDQKH